MRKVAYSACIYGIEDLNLRTKNLQGPTEFVDGGLKRRVQYIHRVSLHYNSSHCTSISYLYHLKSLSITAIIESNGATNIETAIR